VQYFQICIHGSLFADAWPHVVGVDVWRCDAKRDLRGMESNFFVLNKFIAARKALMCRVLLCVYFNLALGLCRDGKFHELLIR
jgi:hypothetical protein